MNKQDVFKLKEEIKNNHNKESLDSANNTSGNLFTKVITCIRKYCVIIDK